MRRKLLATFLALALSGGGCTLTRPAAPPSAKADPDEIPLINPLLECEVPDTAAYESCLRNMIAKVLRKQGAAEHQITFAEEEWHIAWTLPQAGYDKVLPSFRAVLALLQEARDNQLNVIIYVADPATVSRKRRIMASELWPSELRKTTTIEQATIGELGKLTTEISVFSASSGHRICHTTWQELDECPRPLRQAPTLTADLLHEKATPGIRA
ncbi:hypothetical protein ACQEU3_22020 [Spirillospora sp. CA-253888]